MKKTGIKKIKWTGGQRMVPGVGIMTRGRTLVVGQDISPDDAQSYITQGLASGLGKKTGKGPSLPDKKE